MKKKLIVKIILWLLVISWMAFIFSMSAQPAEESSETSGNTVRMILKLLCSDFEDMDAAQQQALVEQNQHLIRKSAHFCGYTLLGMLLSLAIMQHTKKFTPIAFAAGALYAASDELHQRFVPGRSGELKDVLLDSAGVALGCIIIYIIYRLIKRKKSA